MKRRSLSVNSLAADSFRLHSHSSTVSCFIWAVNSLSTACQQAVNRLSTAQPKHETWLRNLHESAARLLTQRLCSLGGATWERTHYGLNRVHVSNVKAFGNTCVQHNVLLKALIFGILSLSVHCETNPKRAGSLCSSQFRNV